MENNIFNKLVRIGRDAECRVTATGKSVASIPCVYDIGFGEHKRSQWIDITIWAKMAESLTPYLKKGKQIVISADDVELETYTAKSGEQKTKLKARAINIELISDGAKAAQQQQHYPTAQVQQPVQRQQVVSAMPIQHPQGGQGFQQSVPSGHYQNGQSLANQHPERPAVDLGFDDDIPF